jgi:O-acetyl-ADP-ribose deacetylase (regulator of RNase III)
MMAKLEYVVGNAVEPRNLRTIIAQGNNNIGAWGSGFVLAINQLSPLPRLAYLDWAKEKGFYCRPDTCVPTNVVLRKKQFVPFELGEIQLVPVTDDLYVANMITQKSCGPFDHLIPFRYDSAQECFYRLYLAATTLKFDHVTMPRIGCGLAGGEWIKVEALINLELVKRGISVDVYDLPVEGKFISRVPEFPFVKSKIKTQNGFSN